MTHFVAYIDGACSGNPGPGGWGAVLIRHENGQKVETVELSGGIENTTNNRMELTAAISALKSLPYPAQITVHTDSRYVHDGITGWIESWKRAHWRRGNKPVKNVDLWKQLDSLDNCHSVTWNWVRGHAGNEGNIRADALATSAVPRD